MKKEITFITLLLMLASCKPTCPCKVFSIRKTGGYYSIAYIDMYGDSGYLHTKDSTHYIGEIIK
jgi:hypothetical protein